MKPSNFLGMFLPLSQQLALNHTWKSIRTISYSNIILNLMLCTLSVCYEIVFGLQRGFLLMFASQSSVSSTVSMTSNSEIEPNKKSRSGHVLRVDPQSIAWIEKFPAAVETIKKAGWYSMCERIGDYHVEVT